MPGVLGKRYCEAYRAERPCGRRAKYGFRLTLQERELDIFRYVALCVTCYKRATELASRSPITQTPPSTHF